MICNLLVKCVLGSLPELSGDENCDDDTVNGNDTGHDNWDNRLDDKLGLQHGDGADADTGLGSAVGSAKVAENEGSDNAHSTEEEGLVGVTVHYANTSTH